MTGYTQKYLTLKVGLQPTGLARDAWNVEKFMRVYAARKKLEMRGAIKFNSPMKNVTIN